MQIPLLQEKPFIVVCFHWKPTEGGKTRNKKWSKSKKLDSMSFSSTSLPLLYKQWSTLHKIYYIQAEILSSAGAIHHPGRETLWMIPPNYVDQPCRSGQFNLVTLVTPGTLCTPASQHTHTRTHTPLAHHLAICATKTNRHTFSNTWVDGITIESMDETMPAGGK